MCALVESFLGVVVPGEEELGLKMGVGHDLKLYSSVGSNGLSFWEDYSGSGENHKES